jgi:hypothetical protein
MALTCAGGRGTRVAYEVEHEVVLPVRLVEVLSAVVDADGAQGTREFGIAGTTDSRQVRPLGLRQLDGEGAHTAGGTVDQNALSCLHLAGSQTDKGPCWRREE